MGIMDDDDGDDAQRVKKGEAPRPKEHIFLSEKVRWWDVHPDDGLERYEGFNEVLSRRLGEWRAAGCPRRKDVGEEGVGSGSESGGWRWWRWFG